MYKKLYSFPLVLGLLYISMRPRKEVFHSRIRLTLEPEQITYVLPNLTNIGPPNTSGFIIPGNLAPYLILAGLIIVVLAAAITGMVRKGRKDKKKRQN